MFCALLGYGSSCREAWGTVMFVCALAWGVHGFEFEYFHNRFVWRMEALIVLWKFSHVWITCRDRCGVVYLRFSWMFFSLFGYGSSCREVLSFRLVFVCVLAWRVDDFVFECFLKVYIVQWWCFFSLVSCWNLHFESFGLYRFSCRALVNITWKRVLFSATWKYFLTNSVWPDTSTAMDKNSVPPKTKPPPPESSEEESGSSDDETEDEEQAEGGSGFESGSDESIDTTKKKLISILPPKQVWFSSVFLHLFVLHWLNKFLSQALVSYGRHWLVWSSGVSGGLVMSLCHSTC